MNIKDKNKDINLETISSSAMETYNLGFKLAKSCQGGEVFLLCGDLGAGKTTLLQGLGAGLGYKKKINSPTFNIMKLYSIGGNKRVKFFCHLDAYRLNSGKDLEALGIGEYLNNSEVVTAIEWSEKVKSIWPKKRIVIEMTSISENERKIKVVTKNS